MPWLHGVLIILQNDFDKFVERSWHYRCSKVWRTIRGEALDGTQAENTGNVEIIGKLQRRVRIYVRDSVHGISLLAIDNWSWVSQNNCSWWCYFSIVERTLRVRSGCIWCQVPSVTQIWRLGYWWIIIIVAKSLFLWRWNFTIMCMKLDEYNVHSIVNVCTQQD